VKDFKKQLQNSQAEYKENSLKIKECGTWRDKRYRHILPEDDWAQNLWENIRGSVTRYFEDNEIAWHKEKDNLLSSQIMCVNLFFPLKQYPNVLKPWLAQTYPDIQDVVGIDLEYIGPENKNYFKETGGRGQNRTSSDVSIEWKDKQGKKNLLLLEFKFTESNFGNCSKKENLDRRLCHSAKNVVNSPQTQCYRALPQVGRTYWQFILDNSSPFKKEALMTETHCPFLYGFYQLMRNQLLAHCIQSDIDIGFHRVEFGVMYHADNDKLLIMSHKFGEERNPFKAWLTLLKNPDTFHVFTIQGFLNSTETGLPHELKNWRSYIKERYRV